MSLARSVIIIIGLMVLANGLFDGAVKDAVVEVATSDEKQEMRNTFYCLAGLVMYPPVKEVWGINIPIPSFDDIIIAGALTTTTLFFLHLIKINNWKLAIGLFVAFWLSYRMFGLILISFSGDGCQTVMDDMASTMSSIAYVSSILGLAVIYKIAKAIK